MTLPYFKSIVPPGDFTSLTRANLAGSIPDRFNEIAAHNPQKTAVCDHVKSLTYLELQRLVSKAAAIIQRVMGPPASAKSVGLIFDPTVESVVGILGVLASGNFFCPISPHDPPARVQDAEINVILTTREAFPDRLRAALQSEQVVFVDELAENDVETVTPATLSPHQLAAILYTSGSTGIPKGVTHTHKTLMHMVRIKGNALSISPSDRIAGLSTFTFGSYYWNVFGTVLSGATLHLYDFYRSPFENLESWLSTGASLTFTALRPPYVSSWLRYTNRRFLRICGSCRSAGKPFIQTTSISFKKNFRKQRRSAPRARRSRPGFMPARLFRHRSRTESIKSPWGLSIRNAVSRCAMTRAANFRPVKRGKSPSVANAFLRAIGSGQSSMPRSMSAVRTRNVTSVRAIWERLPRMDCSIRKADPIFRSRFGGCGST
jgi:AMP-binding enzyme